jgi:hypothetical protein
LAGDDAVSPRNHVIRVALVAAFLGILALAAVDPPPRNVLSRIPEYAQVVGGFLLVGFLMYPVIAIRSGDSLALTGLAVWGATFVLTVLTVVVVPRFLRRHHAPLVFVVGAGALVSLTILFLGTAFCCSFLVDVFGN